MNIKKATYMKLLYFPSAEKNGKYPNPYSTYYKLAMGKYYNVYDSDNHRPLGLQSVHMLYRSLFADVFILNWLEEIGNYSYGRIQMELSKLAIIIMRIRKKKIVWMFHNVYPHSGETKYSANMRNFLLRNSSFIVTHSQEACTFIKGRTEVPAYYYCHPVMPFHLSDVELSIEDFDVLIWGTIHPYKGVLEFISLEELQKSSLKIKIIGTTTNDNLINSIKMHCNSNISLELRRADFNELAAYIKKSRYVLFPYVGGSISSSGAMMDTLIMGGNPVGPNVGAFKDLEKEKVCLIYKDYQDLLKILKSNLSILEEDRERFIRDNTWDSFASNIYELSKIR